MPGSQLAAISDLLSPATTAHPDKDSPGRCTPPVIFYRRWDLIEEEEPHGSTESKMECVVRNSPEKTKIATPGSPYSTEASDSQGYTYSTESSSLNSTHNTYVSSRSPRSVSFGVAEEFFVEDDCSDAGSFVCEANLEEENTSTTLSPLTQEFLNSVDRQIAIRQEVASRRRMTPHQNLDITGEDLSLGSSTLWRRRRASV